MFEQRNPNDIVSYDEAPVERRSAASSRSSSFDDTHLVTADTTTTTTTLPKFKEPSSSRPTQWTHSPVILAMLHDNQMSNCNDVREIYAECLAKKSDDRICITAMRYMSKCMTDNST